MNHAVYVCQRNVTFATTFDDLVDDLVAVCDYDREKFSEDEQGLHYNGQLIAVPWQSFVADNPNVPIIDLDYYLEDYLEAA